MVDQWYYGRSGQHSGPVAFEQLQELAKSAELLPSDLVWKEGMEDWRKADTVEGLFCQPSPTPSTSTVDDDNNLHAEVRRLLIEQKKIEAIKYYMKVTGVGVTEAKQVVDAFEQSESPIASSPEPSAATAISDDESPLSFLNAPSVKSVGQAAQGLLRKAQAVAQSDATKKVVQSVGQVTQRAVQKAQSVARSDASKQAQRKALTFWEKNRENPLFIAAMLIPFPIGFYLIWKHSGWTNKTKWIWTGAGATFLLIALITTSLSDNTRQHSSSQGLNKKESNVIEGAAASEHLHTFDCATLTRLNFLEELGSLIKGTKASGTVQRHLNNPKMYTVVVNCEADVWMTTFGKPHASVEFDNPSRPIDYREAKKQIWIYRCSDGPIALPLIPWGKKIVMSEMNYPLK